MLLSGGSPLESVDPVAVTVMRDRLHRLDRWAAPRPFTICTEGRTSPARGRSSCVEFAAMMRAKPISVMINWICGFKPRAARSVVCDLSRNGRTDAGWAGLSRGSAMGETRKSLLIRAQAGDEASWRDLADLYRPFLTNWLRQQNLPERDRDDLTQEILVSVVKSLPSFEHPGRPGAFRSWLRTIATKRLCDYWRSHEPQATPSGGSGVTEVFWG
jgi:hypothetical protein